MASFYELTMQRSISARTTRLIALLVTAIGFALRLYSLAGESLWYDELLQLNLALADIPSEAPGPILRDAIQRAIRGNSHPEGL